MDKQLTARKRQAMEMRSRIQAVALDLFDRDGFESVAVEQIAQAAGCSVGNIYHYFKSKDELIIQVTSSVDAQYAVLERAYLADTATPARSKLLDFVGQSLEISSRDPSLYRSFIHGLKYPEQAILRDNDSRVYFRVLRELTAACQQEGSISPRRETAGARMRTESTASCKCCFDQHLQLFFVKSAKFAEMLKMPLTSPERSAIM